MRQAGRQGGRPTGVVPDTASSSSPTARGALIDWCRPMTGLMCGVLGWVAVWWFLSAHVKNVKWPDPRRSYRSFLSGYLRALRHSDEQERWWGRYKVTFCLAIPSVLQRGGPATCWGCEECSWRWEAGLLQGGFAFNVSRFSVCNWLSIPLQPAMERLLVNPDSSFFTEAALLDRVGHRHRPTDP